MRQKQRTLSLGSISTGTLSPQDIFEQLEWELRYIRLSRADRRQVQRITREFNALPEDCMTGYDYELLNELYQIAECYAPDYAYLGSHPGDGADIGVWPVEEVFDDRSNGGFDGFIANSREDALPEHTHALEANDHGNATLWRRAGRRWVEVWSVV